jgi:hypothetical protein
MMGRVEWEELGKDDFSEICLIWFGTTRIA